jgi:hypothetical protein
VGAGAGVYVTRRVNRFTRHWAPENVAARAGEKILLFARDVRLQAGAREAQLWEAIEQDRLGSRRDGTGRAPAVEGSRRAALPAPAASRPALTEGAGARRRPSLQTPSRQARRRALPEGAPPPRRVLRADYTIIDKDNDKDGN